LGACKKEEKFGYIEAGDKSSEGIKYNDIEDKIYGF
jgi:hypothetical protein